MLNRINIPLRIPAPIKTTLVVLLTVALALAAHWSANLAVFQLWAAYVPPNETEWLHTRALWSLLAFFALFASCALCAYRLFRTRGSST
jgi:hypothetical protein